MGEACLSLNALLGASESFPDMDQVGNLSKDSPYYDIVSIGLQCGYLKQKPNKDIYLPTAQATYKYISDIFSSALGIDMKSRIIGNNEANDTLTRSEYAELLYQMIGDIVVKNTKKVSEGDVYITEPDVTIANVTVKGNLIITDAVADKDVTLHNVTVTGKLIVRGGGENSINISGDSVMPEIIVKQVNNNVSIKINGSYTKYFLSVVFEAVTMALAIILCNAFINSGLPAFVGSYADWAKTLIYLCELTFTIALTVGSVKGAQSLTSKVLGL